MLVLLLAGSSPTAAAGQWRGDERVVLRDFGDVRAVAVSNTLLYGVTRGGVIVYDYRARRWLPPVTELDGYPVGAEPLVALADPLDETLWVGTTDGLVQYAPSLRQVTRAPVVGAVPGLFFDRSDPFGGLYVAMRDGWYELPRGGLIPAPARRLPPPGDRVGPLTVAEALRDHPAADASRSMALVDRSLRRFEFVSVAEERSRGHLFFGTNGAGIVRYDPVTAEFEPLRFGLLSDHVGAVLADRESVWVGAEAGRGRAGVVMLDRDVQPLGEWEAGGVVGGIRFRDVRALARWNDAVWAATDAGAVRADDPAGDASRVTRDLDAYALGAGADGLWVGTAMGAALIDGSMGRALQVTELPPSLGAVTAIAVVGDSAWMGGPGGLGVVPAGTRRVVRPPVAQRFPALRRGVGAIAAGDGYLAVAAEGTLVWRDPAGAWSEAPPVPGLREVTALVYDDDGLWAAGRDGVTRLGFRDGDLRLALSISDLPGRVNDMAVGDGYLWLATEGGLVRFRRDILLP